MLKSDDFILIAMLQRDTSYRAVETCHKIYIYICKCSKKSVTFPCHVYLTALSVSLLSPRLFLELDMFECIRAGQFKRLKALNTFTPSSTIALRTNEMRQDFFFCCSKAIGSIEVRSSDCSFFFFLTN